MSNSIKLTRKSKREILLLRLEGKSGRDIASQLGMSYQSVYDFLHALPGAEVQDKVLRPDISDKVMADIIERYLDEEPLYSIARSHGLKKKDLVDTFAFIRQSKYSNTHSALYPAVAEWMNTHGYSMLHMAKILDVDAVVFRGIMTGTSFHMSLEIAKKISGVTGLSLEEIFGSVVTPEELKNAETGGELNEQ